MDQNSIKRWQAKKIHAALQPSMNYLLWLRERMEKKGFLPSDPYYQHVCRARDAMQTLVNQTYYMTCSGVGRPCSEEDDEE
jgi:phage anti-repressor protein